MPTRRKQLISIMRDTLARLDSLTDRLEMTLDRRRDWLSDERIKTLKTDIAEQRLSNQKKHAYLDQISKR